MYNHHDEQMTRNGAYARDHYRRLAEQAERERDSLRQLLADIRAFHNNYKGLSKAWHWEEIEARIDDALADEQPQ